jgi:pyridoxal phosphate enzyme (YggS family)
LLEEINKQAVKNNRIINCLLQVHIASEETKFGFSEEEIDKLLSTNINELQELKNIRIWGLMGMASFSNDVEKVKEEYGKLKSIFDKYAQLQTVNCKLEMLSIGMSGDYKIAINEGGTMVRIGSLIFGERNYHE